MLLVSVTLKVTTFTAGDVDFINVLYNYDSEQADISSCLCNEIEVLGLENQKSRNGRYLKTDGTTNGRTGSQILISFPSEMKI